MNLFLAGAHVPISSSVVSLGWKILEGGRGRLIYELKIGLDAYDTGLNCSNLVMMKFSPVSPSLIKMSS